MSIIAHTLVKSINIKTTILLSNRSSWIYSAVKSLIHQDELYNFNLWAFWVSQKLKNKATEATMSHDGSIIIVKYQFCINKALASLFNVCLWCLIMFDYLPIGFLFNWKVSSQNRIKTFVSWLAVHVFVWFLNFQFFEPKYHDLIVIVNRT